MSGAATFPIQETVDHVRGEDIVYMALWLIGGPAVKVWVSVGLDGRSSSDLEEGP